MGIKEFKEEVEEEVATILDAAFKIEVTETENVPHSNDGYITFPNLDAKTQGCKLIETCVLYIDIRRSTELNLRHKPMTVAKLYSSFVRAMTRCANRSGGHVRGIIGDRLMVLFDSDDCFANAIECATLMNSVSRFIINAQFDKNEVKCGIGIDYGKMLVTKTGFRRHGANQGSYKNLVWLGRPANVASKLTDIANKPAEISTIYAVEVARENYNSLAAALGMPQNGLMPNWSWTKMPLISFFRDLKKQHGGPYWEQQDKSIQSAVESTDTQVERPATPPILMTAEVFKKFKAQNPNDQAIRKNLIKLQQGLKIPEYDGDIYGSSIFYSTFEAD